MYYLRGTVPQLYLPAALQELRLAVPSQTCRLVAQVRGHQLKGSRESLMTYMVRCHDLLKSHDTGPFVHGYVLSIYQVCSDHADGQITGYAFQLSGD